jgi:hypothetical protein
LPLLGHPNLAHTAFAYQLQQVIGADDAAGEEAVRSRSSGGAACGRCGIRVVVGRFHPHDGDTFRIRSARQEKDRWSVLSPNLSAAEEDGVRLSDRTSYLPRVQGIDFYCSSEKDSRRLAR